MTIDKKLDHEGIRQEELKQRFIQAQRTTSTIGKVLILTENNENSFLLDGRAALSIRSRLGITKMDLARKIIQESTPNPSYDKIQAMWQVITLGESGGIKYPSRSTLTTRYLEFLKQEGYSRNA